MKKNALNLRFRSVCLLPALLALFAISSSYAGSATWLQSPADNDWSNPSNWTPNSVPNATTDTATFGTTNTAAISIAAPIDLASVTFAAGASAYSITVANNQELNLFGSPNIINNSGVEQNFIAEGGFFYVFGGNETLDSTIHFEIMGGNSTRRNGTLWIQGSNINLGTAPVDFEGGDGHGVNGAYGVFFFGTNAGSSAITLHRGVNGGFPGTLTFETASAGSANITAEGGGEKGGAGGYVTFAGISDAGTSTITLQRPVATGALPATVLFDYLSSANQSTLLADGGSILFSYQSTGSLCRIILTHKGSLDISNLSDLFADATNIGSLEGDRSGNVFLGAKTLFVGSNNTSTVFGGVIQDGGVHGGTSGSLIKTGIRTLTLTGDNQYTGGTTVAQGDFVVGNHSGSATGTGPVQVDGGRIGGAGTIAGALTIGDASGSKATLIPAIGTSKQVTVIIESALTLNSGADYRCALNTTNGTADRALANGVTILPQATFLLSSKGSGTLVPGTVITAIGNTAATPISGNFRGLPEGATILAGNNTYAVSYAGGDGNDFTLTVL
jgi:autotransporter-associated beta strand protein